MGDNHRIAKIIELTCPQCAGTFTRRLSQVRWARKWVGEHAPLCCSRPCARKLQKTGEHKQIAQRRAAERTAKVAQGEATFTSDEFRGEEWKPIPQWEAYEASTFGRVRRVRIGHGTYGHKYLLKPTITRKGYLTVALHMNGRRIASVHALVMETFVGPRPKQAVINHKDGIKTNNRPDNLEYCTNAENMQHAGRLGLMAHGNRHRWRTNPELFPRGEKSPFAKLTEAKVREIMKLLKQGHTAQALSKRYGVSGNRICQIRAGKTWRHITNPQVRPTS